MNDDEPTPIAATSNRSPRRAVSLLLTVLLGGCFAQVGPRQLAPARYHYNQAIARSWDEQFLLNLVRLRYHDTPFFLEISSVLAQYSLSGTGSLSPTLTFGDSDSASIGASLTYTETPTITFTPLQDSAFVSSVLEPISPTTLMLLSEAGSSIDQLFACCVAAVGSLTTDADDFTRLTSALRALEVAGHLAISQTSTADGDEVALVVESPSDDSAKQQVRIIEDLLGLGEADGLTWRLTVPEASREAGTIAITPRSVLGVMRQLAAGVEVPASDVAAGKVEGAVGDAPLLRVRWAAGRPDEAYLAIHYRGAWFYLADNDLASKSVFSLLQLLFAIQSAGGDATPPLLTVSGG